MTITANDIAFFAAAVQTDTADGGGPRSATQLQNGNPAGSIFPAVSAADRSTGRVRLRKIYPSATNANTSALLGASLAINEVPADAAVRIEVFAAAGAAERRAQAETRLQQWDQPFVGAKKGAQSTLGSPFIRVNSLTNEPPLFAEGDTIGIAANQPGDPDGSDDILRAVIITVGAIVTAQQFESPYREYVLDRNAPFSSSRFGSPNCGKIHSIVNPRVYAARSVPLSIDSAAVSFNLSSLTSNWRPVPVVKPGDICTLWHEAATSPATQANGSTVSVGRTDLDQLAVVNSAGVEVVRFLRGGPATGANITANLDTGVVTFVSVTGLAQPVTVRHRIAHRSVVQSLAGVNVTLADALTRDFPANSTLSTHLPLGDIQARAFGAFGQQAWTRVWSDTLIGNPAPLPYIGSIAVTNQGAETDRYAIVMNGPTAFTAYSERIGLLGTGSTTSTFAPLNPATGAALFSLAPGGWAAEQLVGSVLRFNTEGASPPVWVVQSISPSSPSGNTSTALRVFGSV